MSEGCHAGVTSSAAIGYMYMAIYSHWRWKGGILRVRGFLGYALLQPLEMEIVQVCQEEQNPMYVHAAIG
eukprot:7264178-Pyramimonas_sp.AAC.1